MRTELLRLVDMIHREKDIDKEAVFLGLEAAIRSAIAKKFGESDDATVVIDRTNGEVTATVGGQPLDQRQLQEQLGRLAAQTGKQVLHQKIREAAREVVYQEFVSKIGTLVTGTIQRFEGSAIIINLQRGEGVLPRGEQVPSERFRVGDRLKVLVQEVLRNGPLVKIILSRASPLFVRQLFDLEVPEIKDGTIHVINIAREPGQRTKIAVTSADPNVDCVGACVGVRGTRVKSIKEELFGEKIEIVPWDNTQEVLIVNALKPAEIVSIDLDYDRRRARVYVTPDQQSLAIGKRGQNVRLASELCNWDIDIVSVSQDDIKRLRTEDVEQGGDIGEVVGQARGAAPEGEQPAESAEGEQPAESAEGEQPAESAEGEQPAESAEGEQAAESAEGEQAAPEPPPDTPPPDTSQDGMPAGDDAPGAAKDSGDLASPEMPGANAGVSESGGPLEVPPAPDTEDQSAGGAPPE
jgi:transcription termination/antitermination protein NusA